MKVAMGMIKDWKELGCKSGTLTWVHRSDGSGTTKAFTNSMQAFSTTWTLGTGKSVKWPDGVGAKGNSGVAGLIQNREGAIGYVNQSYIKGKVVAAALQNKSGEFLKPSVAAGAKALNGISLDKDLAGKNPNPTAKGAYPSHTHLGSGVQNRQRRQRQGGSGRLQLHAERRCSEQGSFPGLRSPQGRHPGQVQGRCEQDRQVILA